MKQALKDMFASKKFLALVTAVLVWGVGKIGLDLPTEQVAPIVGLIATYILGQGLADLGKERAKVEADMHKGTGLID